ncbi:unnamed protein product [Chrysodeixis includens]|uniref:Lysozyme n=1 Tax=Chrysodeixis includens TaxID=689277 RepID=A0A9P0BW13_CHRIL|nr:unnamed protein product [Chrysodeixis includens]
MPNNMFLGQWVCLIEKESNRDSNLLTVKPSGKKFYGLYQIPSQWCREKKRGGGCNIACEDLLDDDIRDDTACAVKISHLEGFQYWPKWTARCKNDNFITTEIYKCPDLYRTPPGRRVQTQPGLECGFDYPCNTTDQTSLPGITSLANENPFLKRSYVRA